MRDQQYSTYICAAAKKNVGKTRGPGCTRQKRDTKKGMLRQEVGMAPPLPNSAHTETSSYLQNAAKARGFERSFHVRRWRPNWLAGHTPWLALN